MKGSVNQTADNGSNQELLSCIVSGCAKYDIYCLSVRRYGFNVFSRQPRTMLTHLCSAYAHRFRRIRAHVGVTVLL